MSGRDVRYIAALGVVCLVYLSPVLFMAAASTKPDGRVLADLGSLAAFAPGGEGLGNYGDVFERVAFGRYLGNSLWISLWIVVPGLLVNGMCGYALARLRFPGRNLLFAGVLALLIVPLEAIAVPLFFQMTWLGLRDTYLVQIIPFIANAFSIYLFYSAFLGLPRELEEAARLDGAGVFGTFVRIAAPNAKPVFATVAVLTFLTQWGSFMWPLMVTSGPRVRPLPVGLSFFHTLPPLAWGDIFAFCLMMALPVVVLFLILQRLFVRGVMESGIKG